VQSKGSNGAAKKKPKKELGQGNYYTLKTRAKPTKIETIMEEEDNSLSVDND